MTCNLFLPYYNYNDDKFDVKDFYNDNNSYIEALKKFSMQETEMMNFNKSEDEIQYSKCECNLYDENNNPLTIDQIVGYYNTSQMIMLVVELNMDTEEEEFDMELNNWFEEHNKLDKIKNIDEDKRFLLEPKRDVKVIFKNLANKDTYCILTNTMILERLDTTHYAILVDSVVFTKEF